ncbi:hypothetical protein TWF225_010602 [Orbilia oligospora]|nr:hypothetical protein TWF225_010602 [Orbilia oligospora]KAF3250956.1 hypothetical protein TWF128_007384 [Orbilia oligospora]KAF3259115.1 hypothetical protein TWF217_005258 [Orbilia oligospora]KAF3291917.1 hypothetical protein TWF132_006424 [Orbilia oligospora]
MMKLQALVAVAALIQQSIASVSYRRRDTSPWPTEPDIIKTCSRWIEALPGDDCNTLAEIDGVPLADFLAWNPALARNCQGIVVGYGYCTENKGTAPITTTTSSRTTSGLTCPTVSCPVTITVTTTVFIGTTTSRTTTAAITTTTTRSTTPSTTTTTTTTTTKASLAPSQFPSASGTLQCVKSNSPIPQPTQIAGGSTLDTVIASACNSLVTTSNKWLEVGDPYTVVLPVSGKSTTFLLNIKLGGFAVQNSLCQTQLKLVNSGCTASGNTYGGCSYTSDFNLLACVFPNV